MSDVLPSWDPQSAFSALASFGGDLPRTALALRIPLAELEAVSTRYGWPSKLQTLGLAVDSPKGAGSVEHVSAVQRQLNRGANLVQALKARDLVDRVLNRLAKNDETLMDALTTPTKFGPATNIKPLKDLLDAAATAQNLTRLALQDDSDNATKDADILRKAGAALGVDLEKALDAAAATGTTGSAIIRESLTTPSANRQGPGSLS